MRYATRILCKCSKCGEEIYDGDEIYVFDGETYHEDCFRDNMLEILESKGARKEIAYVPPYEANYYGYVYDED